MGSGKNRWTAVGLLLTAALLALPGCSSSAFWQAWDAASEGEVDTSDIDEARERRHQRRMERYARETAEAVKND